MKVVNERVLVKVIAESSTITTPSGLSIPNPSKQEGAEKAEIIVVGGGDSCSCLAVGEECLIYLGAGKEFTNPADGIKYRTISTSEIIVVL